MENEFLQGLIYIWTVNSVLITYILARHIGKGL